MYVRESNCAPFRPRLDLQAKFDAILNMRKL